MSRGLPLSLWKYVLAELWRVILLSAGVLVAVIAFAVAVKPLADGKLTPQEAMKFMGFAIVPMLQYALPFAAGFGATLAYHRLSHDNEVVAAYAGGVSHRAVLMPAMLSGLVLAGAILVLNQQVIPRFLQSMEKLIAADITKIMMGSIERGQALDVGGMIVYADKAARVQPVPESGARDEMALWGVAALELDRQGLVTSDATAASARVWVFPGDRPEQRALPGQAAALVSMRLQDVVGAQRGKWMGQVQSVPIAVPAPGGFKDDPKFLTFGELLELRTEPERMNWIEQRRRDLAVHLGERMLTKWIDEQLRTKGSVTFTDDAGETVTLLGAGIEFPDRLRWDVVPAKEGKPVEIRLARSGIDGAGSGVTVISARSAGLYTDIGPSREERNLTVRLEAENAQTAGRLPGNVVSENVPVQGGGGERRRLTLPDLKAVGGPMEALLDPARTSSSELMRLVAPYVADERARAATVVAPQKPSYFVVPPNEELRRSVSSLLREVTSKQHERFAGAVACFVMVVSGALIAVNLSQSLPLTVYLWSFFPALATIITISSGQQLTHQHGWPGLLVLWGGVGLLALYTFVGYSKLARH